MKAEKEEISISIDFEKDKDLRTQRDIRERMVPKNRSTWFVSPVFFIKVLCLLTPKIWHKQ